MTIARVAFRDFVRGSVPADVLQLWDKKSNRSKGLYITPEYADEMLRLIDEHERARRQKRTEGIMAFAGMLGEIEEPDRSHQAIKASRHE